MYTGTVAITVANTFLRLTASLFCCAHIPVETAFIILFRTISVAEKGTHFLLRIFIPVLSSSENPLKRCTFVNLGNKTCLIKLAEFFLGINISLTGKFQSALKYGLLSLPFLFLALLFLFRKPDVL